MQAASRGAMLPSANTGASALPGRPSLGGHTPWEGSRQHRVTAVLVVHDGVRWLGRTLNALAALHRRPDRVIAVDTGSGDGPGELLAHSELIDTVIELPRTAGFGRAVATAEEYAPVDLTDGAAGVEWLWLLHDDCAPEPGALDALLAEADRTGAAVLGPKVRGWHDESLLVECGLSVTNSGRRYTGLQPGDRDQGQRDDLRDVLAVGSAGMLVRRDVWRRLGGFDPALPLFGDDVEFCMRARRADERVVVVPEAVVHHREAAAHGVRPLAAVPNGPSLSSRAAGMYTGLVHGPAWLLPLTSVVLLLRTLAAAVLHLVSDGPRRAWAELRVWGSVHLHPIRVTRARRRLNRVAAVPRRDLAELRPGRDEQLSAAMERYGDAWEGLFRPRTPGAPLLLTTGLAVAAALVLVAGAATRAVWMANGTLAGGALLPPVDGTTLWQSFTAAWHNVGLGSSEPAAAYPLVLAAAALPPVVSVDLVVSTLLLFTVPMAALSAFLALRGAGGPLARVLLAVAYALTPAVIVPSLDGRVGTAAVAVLLPWLLRLLVRMYAAPEVATLPPAGPRTAVMAALLLAVCAAFAPLVWVAAAVLLLLVSALRVRRAALWASTMVVLLLPVVLLWPWSGAVAADPSRLMFEAGISSPQLVAAVPPGWRLLLLDPGTLGPQTAWVAVGLVAAAVLALLRPASRGAALWGWALVAVGLLGATVQTTQKFAPLGATTAQFGFAGPMLLLMAAGLVLALAGLVRHPPAATTRTRRWAVAGLPLLLLLGPAALVADWTTELQGPLQRSDANVVPAFVEEAANSAAAVRTLLLQQGPDDTTAYALVNGSGGRLGDADVAPPAQTWREISAAVSALVAGVGPEPVAVLADNAVAYIVADAADAPLAAALDGNPALRRLSTNDGRGLWRVAQPASRARLATPEGEQPIPALTPQQMRSSGGTVLDTQLPDTAGLPGELLVAQANDGGWRATLDGEPLPLAGEHSLSIAVPARGSGTILLQHDQRARQRALLVPVAGLLLLALLSLPRGRRQPDPDREPEQDPAGTRGLDGGPEAESEPADPGGGAR